MLLLIAILVLLGAGVDIAVNGWMGQHIVLILCSLVLAVFNFIGDRISFGKLNFGKSAVKTLLSMAVLVLMGLFLSGAFSFGSFDPAADSVNSMIREVEKIREKEGVEKALAWLEEAERGKEWNRDVTFLRAELLLEIGDISTAKNRISDIFYRNPNDFPARYEYAKTVLKQKLYNEALNQLLYIVKADPAHADAHGMLGRVYGEMGDQTRRIFYLKLAVQEAPDSADKRMELAKAYADMHSYREADVEYKKALELSGQEQ